MCIPGWSQLGAGWNFFLTFHKSWHMWNLEKEESTACPYLQDYQMRIHSVNLSRYESWRGFQTPPQEVRMIRIE